MALNLKATTDKLKVFNLISFAIRVKLVTLPDNIRQSELMKKGKTSSLHRRKKKPNLNASL